jgi:tRNA threonylcarbamoyladenosine biosynthesis protein TsaB
MATQDKAAQIKILAFDTAMEACSVAVLVGNDVVAASHEEMRRGQAERLLVMVGEVCDAAGLTHNQFDYLMTTIGPGSFTGVRVALAAAKGMALVTGVQVIPLTTTEVMAASASALPDGSLTVAIDARREQLYLQQFQIRDGEILGESEPMIVALSALPALRPDTPLTTIGSGRHLICEVWPNAQPLDIESAKASDFVGYGAKHIARAQPATDVLPLYLRAPDAKLPKAK